jgi:tetratricopeptide (TPR) repeat protein
MAEEAERLDARAEAAAVGADPAAIVVALGSSGTLDPRAAEFLKKQEALIEKQGHLVDLQARELAHELRLRHWSLQLRHASAILKFALEVSAALVGVAIVCFIGAVVWNAAHADGLVVDEFSVPPDLAARGLTGQAIAGQLMDKLSEMQNVTITVRAPRSYANNWDNNIKVEIPETGVSIGQVYNFLKSWLGHETHLSGDVWRTQTGLAITARTNNGSSNTVSGTEPDLDSVIQQTAEGIYGLTQSYRYAQYLFQHDNRIPEAFVRYKSLATTGDPNERGWGYLGWTNYLIDRGDVTERERLLKESQQYGNVLLAGALANLENNLGRPELARSYEDKVDALLRSSGGALDPRAMRGISKRHEAVENALRADYRAAAQDLLDAGITNIGPGLIRPFYTLAEYQVREHDVTGAGRALENSAPSPSTAVGANLLAGLSARMHMAQEVGEWKTVLADAEAMIPLFRQYPGVASLKSTLYDPPVAIAEARLGQFADAERRISPTPADCYPCLMARGRIAAIQGQNARADWWYARAVGSNPSIPLAESEWGRSLLARGQPDAAIEKFKLANQKGPHFADPLEGWGEALMAKNQSHLALAKFAEADKYAPNWGRLHLKWGEALVYAGRHDGAKAQFARAVQLDLTPSEKSELARMTAHD